MRLLCFLVSPSVGGDLAFISTEEGGRQPVGDRNFESFCESFNMEDVEDEEDVEDVEDVEDEEYCFPALNDWGSSRRSLSSRENNSHYSDE